MMRQLLKQHVGPMGRSSMLSPQDQPDLLDPEELLPLAAGHSGFPEATDGLAYEPVQRLLAVRPCAPPAPRVSCTGDATSASSTMRERSSRLASS